MCSYAFAPASKGRRPAAMGRRILTETRQRGEERGKRTVARQTDERAAMGRRRVKRASVRQRGEGILSTKRAACTFMQAARPVDQSLPTSPHSELPSQQRKVLRAIDAYQKQNRTWPTMEQLATLIGISPRSNPGYLVQPLRKKGYLVRPAVRAHRVLELTPQAEAWLAEDARRTAAEELNLQPPPAP